RARPDDDARRGTPWDPPVHWPRTHRKRSHAKAVEKHRRGRFREARRQRAGNRIRPPLAVRLRPSQTIRSQTRIPSPEPPPTLARFFTRATVGKPLVRRSLGGGGSPDSRVPNPRVATLLDILGETHYALSVILGEPVDRAH